MARLDERLKADRQYDPYTDAKDLYKQEQATGKDAGTNAGVNQTQELTNNSSTALNYINQRETTAAGQGSRGNIWNRAQETLKGKYVKKGGPIAGIIGIILSGIFGISLLSPGLLLVQFKEALADAFNDQLPAMEIRTTALLKKKLGATTTQGICNPVSIRCKYRTIGNRQVEKLKKAGFEIECRGTITGRCKPQSFTFNGRSIAARDMLREASRDPALRSALRKGYNPKFAAFSDAVAKKIHAKLGIKKQKNITPGTEDDMREQLKEQSSTGGLGDEGRPERRPVTDADGEPTGEYEYYDSEGQQITKDRFDQINSGLDEIDARSDLAETAKKAGVKAGIKGALTSTAFGLGAVDSACGVWNLIRVASFAAKIYGQRQLIRYAYAFLNTADTIKAIDADPEGVEFAANILTSVNAEGKSATDSDGYRYAAYGDEFEAGKFDTSIAGQDVNSAEGEAAIEKAELQNETAKYVNGQIIPDNIIGTIINKIDQFTGSGKSIHAIDDACGFVASGTGQAILITTAVIGGVVAFFTGGASVSVGAIAQASVGVAIGIALGLLTPKLMDLAKGEVITGNENGNEAGNAIVSGMGGYNHEISQASALPALTKDDAVDYGKTAETVMADYAEVARYEADPLDPTTKYSFLGGIVNSLLPYSSKLSNGSSFFSALTSLTSKTLLSPFNNTAGALEPEKDDYTCSDEEYKSKDLAADPFCNIRHGLSDEALAIDPEVVLDYMLDGDYIGSAEDPTPQGEYAEYIDRCVDRETVIGDTVTNDEEGDGSDCIQGTASGAEERKRTMFRLFYLDQRITEGMDAEASQSTAGAVQVKAASYNILTQTFTGGAPWDNYSTADQQRTTKQAEFITSQGFDVIGLQEASAAQRNGLAAALPGYKVIGSATAILWNASKFSLVEQGSFQIPKHIGDKNVYWVKLRAPTGGEFVFFSMHADVGPEYDNNRTRAAERVMQEVDRLSPDGTTPIIITGDMNGGDRGGKSQVYNTFMRSGKLKPAIETASNVVNGNCDTYQNGPDQSYKSGDGKQNCRNGRGSIIDWIYVSITPAHTVNTWENYATNETVTLSDHNPISANISIDAAGAGGPYKNPIYNGNAPDPAIIRGGDGTYHVYATGRVHLTSTDMINWTRKNNGWNLQAAPRHNCMWAPDVAQIGSKYVMTYTAGSGDCSPGDGSTNIHYAVGNSAAGPFRYRGVVNGLKSAHSYPIDSHIFVDGDTAWLFYGGGVLNAVQVQLNGTTLDVRSGTMRRNLMSRINPSDPTLEGWWVTKKDGWYYLYYSYGHWSSKSGAREYSTRIARSRSVAGPYQPQNQYKELLNGKNPFRAPGHNSVITDNAGTDWIIYHAYRSNGNNRMLLMDRIIYTGGWPTVAGGVPSSTLQPGPVTSGGL